MRLLFVHDNAGVCQSLAVALNMRGYEARVITRKGSTKDLSLGTEYVRTTDTLRVIPTLISIFQNRNIDLINSNNYSSWVAGEVSRRILRVPHVITLHGSDARNLFNGSMLPFKRNFLIKTLRSSSMILATTPDLLTFSQSIGKEVLHLPQPINTGIFNCRALKVESLCGDPIVFSPTRLDDNKGAKTLIWVLGQLVASFPSVHIYQLVSGNPQYISLLKSTLPSKNLTLVTKRARDLMPSWYVSSDLVMGQNEFGILSNTELEAMSCGVPVLVYDRYYGYGYQEKNPQSAWEMTKKILSDPAYREHHIEKGLQIIKEKHERNKVSELYLEYVRQMFED